MLLPLTLITTEAAIKNTAILLLKLLHKNPAADLKSIITFLFFPACIAGLRAQTALTWAELADVSVEEVHSAEDFITYNQADFGSHIITRADSEVYITGYLIPIDAMGLTYALSRNPNASCFFCGGAGPETVLLLRIAPSSYKRYKTDERLTFAGTLRLNENDLNSFIYVLEGAEEY